MYKSCYTCRWREVQSGEQIRRCNECMSCVTEHLPLWEPKEGGKK